MATSIAYLEAVVGADISSFRRGMAEVRGELTETAGLGSGLQQLGSTLTMALTLPILGIGAASLKTFADLDSAMRNTNSIAGLSEDQFQKLEDQVVQFGKTTKDGATSAANALYTVISAGYGVNNVADAFTVMQVAVKTAEAGLADTESTTTALTSALLAYNATADQAAHYSDIITKAVQLGVGTMDDFTGSLGQVIATAALAGVNFQDLSASAAFLTQRGLSFSEAFTALNGVFRTLIKPGEALQAVFAQLGVATGTDLIKKFGGLEGAMKAIGDTAGTSAETLSQLFPEIRALRGAGTIFNSFDQYASTMQDFGDTLSGVTDKAHQEQVKSLAYQFDLFKSSVGGALDVIGKKLAPAFEGITKPLTDFFNMLSSLDSATLGNIIQLGAVLALLPPVIWAIGFAMDNLPIIALITGILLLKKAFDDNFLGIKTLWENIILPALTYFIGGAEVAIQEFAFYVGYWLNNIKEAFNQYLNTDLTALLHDVFIGNWERVKQDLASVWGDIQALFWDKFATPIGDWLANFGADKFEGLVLGFTSVAVAVGIAATALALANLPAVVGAIGVAFAALISPMTLAVAVAVGLVLAYEANLLGFRDFVTGIGNDIRGMVDLVKNAVRTALEGIVIMDTLLGRTDDAKAALQSFYSVFGEDLSAAFPQYSKPVAAQSAPTNPLGALGSIANFAANPGAAIGNAIINQPTSQQATSMWNLSPSEQSGVNDFYNSSVAKKSLADVSGYTHSPTNGAGNTVIVQTQEPDAILRYMRAQGIDLGASKRG